MKTCGHCEQQYVDDDTCPDGYCSKQCRRCELQSIANEAKIDWFGVVLRRNLIKDGWSDTELQQRCRVDQRPERVEVRDIPVNQLDTVA